MVVILALYLVLVYLLFFKLHWLPWNKATQGITLVLGLTILLAFMVALDSLTPKSSQAVLVARVIEIAPQVSGRVDSVQVQPNVVVDKGTVLFTINPTAYQARVDQLVAQVKLARVRLDQFKELASKNAGSQFQLQQGAAQLRQVEAQLAGARFDLENTSVVAPVDGMVPRGLLQVGAQVSASKSVMAFIDTSEYAIATFFEQKALRKVKVGNKAMVNFPALPGQMFETTVRHLPTAIGEGQIFASAQLPSVQEQHMVRIYLIYVTLPDDFPEHLLRTGLAAQVYIHTDDAGMVSPVALAMQWIATSLDLVL